MRKTIYEAGAVLGFALSGVGGYIQDPFISVTGSFVVFLGMTGLWLEDKKEYNQLLEKISEDAKEKAGDSSE